MTGTVKRKVPSRDGGAYAVYTYDLPASGRKGQWQRRDTRAEITDALLTAEKMFRSGRYQKVEVKQKVFDAKQNRNVDITLKTFQSAPAGEVDMEALLFFAFVWAAIAFIGAYYFYR